MSSSVTQQIPAACLPASINHLPLACGSELKRKWTSQSSARCTPVPPAPVKRGSSTVVRRQRRLSLLRPAPTKPSAALPLIAVCQSDQSPPSKKKTRLPLQSIHIRALEHGLRVPVSNTPLGIVDSAENIACGSDVPRRPLTALPLSSRRTARPALTSRPATPISSSPAMPTGTRSAPQSPSRPPRLSRRNSIACVRPALVFNL
ncbi:hypothetical protein IW140_001032 [Coemansia sp. RSA 1813]|nr:hypothetical protein LPJ74_002890 [Coemansia sp. RSA 1843]KAJ2091516.1 hypothetical protein IW138_001744 [Coemansia sp. RSA 986]KAJ2215183.1 hypothetical protein EV179_002402 [Coemansia sp. RSA 487]KAJ2572283.1 hypothetical protein IW140_001032 [Coemansia sp. RSA 1813]